MTPRYPQIQVTTHSRNPLAAVGAVRHALRRAGVTRNEIRLFSAEAFDRLDPQRLERFCSEWVSFRVAPCADRSAAHRSEGRTGGPGSV